MMNERYIMSDGWIHQGRACATIVSPYSLRSFTSDRDAGIIAHTYETSTVKPGDFIVWLRRDQHNGDTGCQGTQDAHTSWRGYSASRRARSARSSPRVRWLRWQILDTSCDARQPQPISGRQM